MSVTVLEVWFAPSGAVAEGLCQAWSERVSAAASVLASPLHSGQEQEKQRLWRA